MDLIFITEARFYKAAQGIYYAGDMSYNNKLWERYLEDFNNVYVVARIFNSNENFDKDFVVDNVHFLPLPSFDGIFSFMKNLFEIKKCLNNYLVPNHAVIIRGGGILGYSASKICKNKKIKYGIEVIGDPYEVFAPGVIKHPLRPFFRGWFTYIQKVTVKRAIAAIYVTKFTLQKRYPASEKAFSTYASDVFLDLTKPITAHKSFQDVEKIKLISVGSLDQMYKSPDILIKAVKILVEKEIDVHLVWLGKGKCQGEMEQLCKDLSISDNVQFVGAVPSDEVTNYLDNSDIFLLVSRTEGLPRAVVEAMSRGLPCIGTRVGGIPELLLDEALVAPESSQQIADKIFSFFDDKSMYSKHSLRNLENSQEYSFDVLNGKRKEFYKYLTDFKVNSEKKNYNSNDSI